MVNETLHGHKLLIKNPQSVNTFKALISWFHSCEVTAAAVMFLQAPSVCSSLTERKKEENVVDVDVETRIGNNLKCHSGTDLRNVFSVIIKLLRIEFYSHLWASIWGHYKLLAELISFSPVGNWTYFS